MVGIICVGDVNVVLSICALRRDAGDAPSVLAVIPLDVGDGDDGGILALVGIGDGDGGVSILVCGAFDVGDTDTILAVLEDELLCRPVGQGDGDGGRPGLVIEARQDLLDAHGIGKLDSGRLHRLVGEGDHEVCLSRLRVFDLLYLLDAVSDGALGAFLSVLRGWDREFDGIVVVVREGNGDGGVSFLVRLGDDVGYLHAAVFKEGPAGGQWEEKEEGEEEEAKTSKESLHVCLLS